MCYIHSNKYVIEDKGRFQEQPYCIEPKQSAFWQFTTHWSKCLLEFSCVRDVTKALHFHILIHSCHNLTLYGLVHPVLIVVAILTMVVSGNKGKLRLGFFEICDKNWIKPSLHKLLKSSTTSSPFFQIWFLTLLYNTSLCAAMWWINFNKLHYNESHANRFVRKEIIDHFRHVAMFMFEFSVYYFMNRTCWTIFVYT